MDTPKYNVRQATQDDLFEIMVLCHSFYKEAPDTHKGFNKDKVEANLNGVIESPNGIVLLLEKDDEVVGMLIGIATCMLFCDTIIASELAFFVDKEHRGLASLRLIKEFEKWAKAGGANKIVMSDLTQLQSLAPLYERMGYTLSETSFTKEA